LATLQSSLILPHFLQKIYCFRRKLLVL